MVNVHHNGMAVRLIRSAVYPMQWMELMICCGMAGKRMGMLGVSVRKMKALTVEVETVRVFGNWKVQCDMLCVLSG